MKKYGSEPAPIGVFDSGYGGLTILEQMRKELPEYDFIYLGDNARAPYGSRSFDVVYEFTRQAVACLFEKGCHLVILACNTASAKALRSIQQQDLPGWDAERRVLGVIRPTVEQVVSLTRNGHVGVFGTAGTIQSESYPLELHKLAPDLIVTGEACPMWVPLVENREADSPGADYFVRKYIDRLFERDPKIDTVVLGCTHYPLLAEKIGRYLPAGVSLVSQGGIVAASLKTYLERHPEMERRISRGGSCRYLTSESTDKFSELASVFLKEQIEAHHVII